MRTKRCSSVTCGRCVASSAKPFGKTFEQAGVVGFATLEHRGVRLQQDVDGGDRARLEREDLLPIVLHADDGPAGSLRLLVKRRREGPELGRGHAQCRAVGVFACRVIVQHEQSEARAAAALRVFQHVLVTHGIAECGNGRSGRCAG